MAVTYFILVTGCGQFQGIHQYAFVQIYRAIYHIWLRFCQQTVVARKHSIRVGLYMAANFQAKCIHQCTYGTSSGLVQYCQHTGILRIQSKASLLIFYQWANATIIYLYVFNAINLKYAHAVTVNKICFF